MPVPLALKLTCLFAIVLITGPSEFRVTMISGLNWGLFCLSAMVRFGVCHVLNTYLVRSIYYEILQNVHFLTPDKWPAQQPSIYLRGRPLRATNVRAQRFAEAASTSNVRQS